MLVHTSYSRQANWKGDCDVIIHPERTSESCWESEQMYCCRVGWTADYHFGPSASERQKVGRVRDVLAEIQDFLHERSGQHLILGGDFSANFYGLTDVHHVGESTPMPRTLTDTER